MDFVRSVASCVGRLVGSRVDGKGTGDDARVAGGRDDGARAAAGAGGPPAARGSRSSTRRWCDGCSADDLARSAGGRRSARWVGGASGSS